MSLPSFICVGDYIFPSERIMAVYPNADNEDFEYAIDIDLADGSGVSTYYIGENEYHYLVDKLRVGFYLLGSVDMD